ncbi:retrovirus-related pol polyprotein from transposon TNT 1-94 [Tanacetum coccineum]
MHNNIMAAGSKDRPPMLGPGRYSQWRSRFLRYIDTKPNGEGLRKSILSGPYVPSTVLVQAVAATEGNPAIQQHTTIETVLNMTPENKEHFLSEKEAIFLLLTGIGDDIYSTVDACKTANEMWIAIERLQQGESLNVQDVKTNLFWEFGKFTSRDGESMESYYSRFYKLMNELTRNNLQVTTMQVNVQFLQQLQPEWSRFVTVVKQSKEIDTISYHTLFDILKQYQNEVNDIRAERIAKSVNSLALLAAAQPYSDNYTQAWLWHRRLSHLNFDYIILLSTKDIVTGLPKLIYVKDQLCSSCEMSKAKRSSFKSKVVPSSKGRLNLLHMDLCGPMRVASINGKKYILVIVDDYSRYTWTLFLRSKDETLEVLKDFLTMIQRNLQAQVISVRTDKGTKFLNKTLHAYFK